MSRVTGKAPGGAAALWVTPLSVSLALSLAFSFFFRAAYTQHPLLQQEWNRTGSWVLEMRRNDCEPDEAGGISAALAVLGNRARCVSDALLLFLGGNLMLDEFKLRA